MLIITALRVSVLIKLTYENTFLRHMGMFHIFPGRHVHVFCVNEIAKSDFILFDEVIAHSHTQTLHIHINIPFRTAIG